MKGHSTHNFKKHFYRTSLLIILLVLVATYTKAHDFYVGILNCRHNPITNSLQVEIKLTTHDLEKAILLQQKQELKLASTKEHPNSNKLIAAYIESQLKIEINGVLISPNFVGKEVDLDENIFVFYEIKCPDIVHEIKMKNAILMDIFQRQENITHIEIAGKCMSFTFNHLQTEKVFTLKKGN
jgi:hypothetical protein